MEILHTVAELRAWSRRERNDGGNTIGLVPTMGALHEGHASLIRAAAQACGTVAVSIFVNPAQFGPNEDFSRYPRTFREDRRLCAGAGVDLLFHPSPGDIYPDGYSTYVNEERLSLPLCGDSRPGHFRGVCTVVLKIFNIVGPDLAVFGEKDYQQAAVIRRMVRDLNVPVKIVTAPTFREPDGLAMSSRNRYLNPAERAQAPVIRRALLLARAARYSRPAGLARLVRREISAAPLARIEYIQVLDAATLDAPHAQTRKLLIACAVYFGKTRLIDNLVRNI